MTEKHLNTRIIHKHDTEANWNKAVNFIPKQGELIVYDIDENYDYERIKIGDGVNNIGKLSFFEGDLKAISNEKIEDICNEIAGHIENVGGKGKYKIVHDREAAIKTAIEDVKDTAVIILAGKGAENHQKRGLVSEDYASDAVLARKYLKEYDERQGK